MKSLRNDKYYNIDRMNMILGIVVIFLGVFAFLDLPSNSFVLPFILFLGGVMNLSSGNRYRGKRKLLAATLLGMGIVFLLGACISWMGFGGYL